VILQAATLAVCGFTLLVIAYLTLTTERLAMSTQESVDAIVAAGVPAEQVDLTALTAAAQALDDVVADDAPPFV